MFLSSGYSYVRELLELPQECQGPFRGSRGKVAFLLRCHSRKGPHLALWGESPGFSRVAEGNMGFLLTYDRDIKDPLILLQESPLSMRVVRGLSGFLCSRCLGQGSLLALRLDLRFPLQCPHGSQGSYGVSKGSQASSDMETWKSAFLSSWKSSVRLPVGLA